MGEILAVRRVVWTAASMVDKRAGRTVVQRAAQLVAKMGEQGVVMTVDLSAHY